CPCVCGVLVLVSLSLMFRPEAVEAARCVLRSRATALAACVLAPPFVCEFADLREQVADVLAAPYHLAHSVVGEARVEAVIPQTAGRDGIGLVVPLIGTVSHRAKVPGSCSENRQGKKSDRGEQRVSGAHLCSLLFGKGRCWLQGNALYATAYFRLARAAAKRAVVLSR